MTPEEVHRMPLGQFQTFKRYQNHYVKEAEKATSRRR